MQKSRGFTVFFIVFLLLSILVFFLSKAGFLRPVESLMQGISAPFQAIAYGFYSNVVNFGSKNEATELKNQNLVLTKKIIDQNRLIADNKALRDQFQTQSIRSQNLIPADVVGAPGFIPGVSFPEVFVIDRGQADGLNVGDAVLVKDNLIGKISKTTQFTSSIILISNSSLSFTAKTLSTNALGVIKGQGGGEMILDNVLLSDKLQKGDTVITRGDVNEEGAGFVPDLIVGKISSISKNPSDLFQKAEIKTLLDFTKINMVFVLSLR